MILTLAHREAIARGQRISWKEDRPDRLKTLNERRRITVKLAAQFADSGESIRKLRLAIGISQAVFAQRLGWDLARRQYVSKLETGMKMPRERDIEDMYALAAREHVMWVYNDGYEDDSYDQE
jgi:DNA-binding transcriptional regulator YiaG